MLKRYKELLAALETAVGAAEEAEEHELKQRLADELLRVHSLHEKLLEKMKSANAAGAEQRARERVAKELQGQA